MQKVCVVGLGYIGLPTASLLATKGFEVLGVDIRSQVVDTINQGKIHIYEPDLDILVKAAVQSGNLKASLCSKESDVFILAVPTPFIEENKAPDLSYVEAATRSICASLKAGDLVILESTSPVGTTEKIAQWISEERTDLVLPGRLSESHRENQIYIAHCPERVLPGNILKELVENDRVVGGIDRPSSEKAFEFYSSFVSGEIFSTFSRTAEMAKLTENTFRDINIAFANELSMISDELEIDVWELIRLANRHPRVNILNPGPGVGGHCIAVDPWFIVNAAPKTALLTKKAREVNDSKPEWVIQKVLNHADKMKTPTIGCLGLSFKANIDDLRESPSLAIVESLAERTDYQLMVVEPHIHSCPEILSGKKNVEFSDLQSAIQKSDIVLLLVDHDEFKEIDPKVFEERILIDTRGAFA